MALTLSDFQQCTLQQWGNGVWGIQDLGCQPEACPTPQPVCTSVYSGMLLPLVLSQSIWKGSYYVYSVFILSQYQQMVKCHSLALSFLLLYVSDCWHNFSRICLGNFEHLTFSAWHLVSSLQSHKRKWLLEGHSYIDHQSVSWLGGCSEKKSICVEEGCLSAHPFARKKKWQLGFWKKKGGGGKEAN